MLSLKTQKPKMQRNLNFWDKKCILCSILNYVVKISDVRSFIISVNTGTSNVNDELRNPRVSISRNF